MLTIICNKLKNEIYKCALDVIIWEKYPESYVLKMDVAKFFDNIDRNILFNIIERKISDRNFLNKTFF